MSHRRTNGFQAPRNNVQVASWLLFLSFVALFYALFLPIVDGVGGRIAAGVVYGFFALATIAANASAAATDPADPSIFNAEEAGATLDAVLYCYRCQRHVREFSKHCTICHKCVDVFDRACGVVGGVVTQARRLTPPHPRAAPQTTASG